MNSETVSETHLMTDCKVVTTVVPWHLKGWDLILKRKDKITFSDISLVEHSCKFSFSFCISQPYGTTQNYFSGYLSVQLHDSNGLRSKFSVSPSVQNSFNKTKIICGVLPGDLISKSTQTLEFKLMTPLQACIEKNVLTIYVRIEEFFELNKIVNESIHANEESLQADTFGELYKNQAFVDVTFIVGPEKQLLRAHAVVLAAVCPYFSSMLNGSNMKEQSTRIVDLSDDTDISVNVFQGFLDYVYGIKKVGEMSDITKELSILADKYNFIKLRHTCDRVLCESLSKDNVVSLLAFAHQYNFELLKRKALNLAINSGVTLKDFEGIHQISPNSKLFAELSEKMKQSLST